MFGCALGRPIPWRGTRGEDFSPPAGGEFAVRAALAGMATTRRANGAGSIYIKHGSFYGRWYPVEGGQVNRKLGAVRRPGSRDGLTRGQAEKRLRELMVTVQVTTV